MYALRQVVKGVKPDQKLVSVVNEELIQLMGGEQQGLIDPPNGPQVPLSLFLGRLILVSTVCMRSSTDRSPLIQSHDTGCVWKCIYSLSEPHMTWSIRGNPVKAKLAKRAQGCCSTWPTTLLEHPMYRIILFLIYVTKMRCK